MYFVLSLPSMYTLYYEASSATCLLVFFCFVYIEQFNTSVGCRGKCQGHNSSNIQVDAQNEVCDMR